jgi:hypothetical protein
VDAAAAAKEPYRVGFVSQLARIGRNLVAIKPQELKGIARICNGGADNGVGPFSNKPRVRAPKKVKPDIG